MSTDNRRRYRRIAPFYDLLDLPFEYARYRPLRRMLFTGLTGRILDAGVGTGRNLPFYPPGAQVVGIDASAEMLARAEARRAQAAAPVELLEQDVRSLSFPDASFDAVTASFLFCVLPDADHVAALREMARVCRPGGEIRLLDYTLPRAPLRRALTRAWAPWVRWAYGASFDRNVVPHLAAAGLVMVERRLVVDDLIQYVVARPGG